jgi:hypothetical protein
MPETVILYCSDICLYTSGYSVSQGVCPLGKDCQGFDQMNNIFCNSWIGLPVAGARGREIADTWEAWDRQVFVWVMQ